MPTSLSDSKSLHRGSPREWLLCLGLALFAVYAAVVPFRRAFYTIEVNYNEGWNTYNAYQVVHHAQLYATKYGWKPVNYPAFSFVAIGELARVTHDYLFTGRMLSLLGLLGCCLLIGAIVKKATGMLIPAIISGLFCLAVFCARADTYVGMDDPQMMAQIFFLAGLLLYISREPDELCLAGTALLFIIGGGIKHNLIDFPLAVLLDLSFVSIRRALHFVAYAAVLAVLLIAANIFIGGPFLISNLLTPRLYTGSLALRSFLRFYGPIQLAFLAAMATAFYTIKKPATRLLALWFFASLVVGIGFAGGSGVTINMFFSNLLATSALLGVLIATVWTNASKWEAPALKYAVPILLFGSLIFPMQTAEELRPIEKLNEIQKFQPLFKREVAFLKGTTGPALCESLLRCFLAGKPYLYDPYGGTNLIRLGKMDSGEIVAKIHEHYYGAIQLYTVVQAMSRPNDHFVDPILAAIKDDYDLALDDKDCAIYVPKTKTDP